MTRAAIVFRILDDYLYNAGLILASIIVLAGIFLCLKAAFTPPAQGRASARRLILEDAAFRDE